MEAIESRAMIDSISDAAFGEEVQRATEMSD